MADVPNVRLINWVDTPASVHYSQHGEGQVQLDPKAGSIIDITGFRRVSIRIGTTKATSAVMNMGKISGPTLSQFFNVPLDGDIHTFEVVGPEMVLWLRGGQPNSQESVQLWVYLRS